MLHLSHPIYEGISQLYQNVHLHSSPMRGEQCYTRRCHYFSAQVVSCKWRALLHVILQITFWGHRFVPSKGPLSSKYEVRMPLLLCSGAELQVASITQRYPANHGHLRIAIGTKLGQNNQLSPWGLVRQTCPRGQRKPLAKFVYKNELSTQMHLTAPTTHLLGASFCTFESTSFPLFCAPFPYTIRLIAH